MKLHSKLILFPFIAGLLLIMVNCDKEESVKQANLITLSTTDITVATARSGGNVTNDGGGEITSRGVVWNTTENPTLDEKEAYTDDGKGIGMFVSEITGLTPYTTYYVRAYAANEAGIVYGNEQQFTTRGNQPVLTTKATANITPYSVETGGIITLDGGAPIIARGVLWSKSPNPTIDDHEGLTTDGNGLGEFTSTITELSHGTPYYFRAYASNRYTTGYGEQNAFTTKIGGNGQPGIGVTDIDGNFYPSVIIGNQEWMAENLRVTRDASGNNITRYCYNNDSANCNIYGGFYSWQTVMNGTGASDFNPSNVQGICPTGWHVPSSAEWDELMNYVVSQGFPNEYEHPNGVGTALKSCRQVSSPLGGECASLQHPRWDSHSTHFGIDEFGFSALPAGVRNLDGTFRLMGQSELWWSCAENSTTEAWARGLGYHGSDLNRFFIEKDWSSINVRCLRD